jgi:hypothetical protein
MNPITADEMTLIRTDAAATLDLPCEVQRKVVVRDSVGTGTEVKPWPTIYQPWSIDNPTGLLCGMSTPTASQLQNYSELIGNQATYQVRFPNATALQLQDHLIVAGETLVVQVTETPQSYSALLTVMASEIKEK